MQRVQKRLQKIKGILVLIVMCSLFFNLPPTAQGFIASTTKELGLLLKRIDKPQWKIGYNFTADCPEAFRQQEEQLKQVIVKALQAWLQPLRERYPNRHFTDDFLFLRQPDFVKCEEDRPSLNQLDTRITFDCKGKGRSFAAISLGAAPDLCIKTQEEVGIHWSWIFALVHELGHALLHYAVQRGEAEMMKTLLAQAGIKVNLLNGHRRTPAQLARVLKQIQFAKMIEAHPTAKWHPVAWDVSPKGRLTTTWGALKRRQ